MRFKIDISPCIVLPAVLIVAALVTPGCVALAGSGGSPVVVSQRDRQFAPGVIAVSPGQPVTIVNDDAGIVHHAYVESQHFNFDSGDQRPGASAIIAFPSAGDYTVLCGIHPKMKLIVHVR